MYEVREESTFASGDHDSGSRRDALLCLGRFTHSVVENGDIVKCRHSHIEES